MTGRSDNTARDKRILKLRAQGKSQSEIADELRLEFDLVRSIIRRAKKAQAEDITLPAEPAAETAAQPQAEEARAAEPCEAERRITDGIHSVNEATKMLEAAFHDIGKGITQERSRQIVTVMKRAMGAFEKDPSREQEIFARATQELRQPPPPRKRKADKPASPARPRPTAENQERLQRERDALESSLRNQRQARERAEAKADQLQTDNRALRNSLTEMQRASGVELALEVVVADPTLQPRQSMSEATIDEYKRAVDDGEPLPPGVVYHDGERYWLADGFHRREARRRAGRTTMLAEVRAGTHRDALLYAASANGTHGLTRSDEDKRHQVLILLHDEEWREWSDREIARHCHVTHPTVAKYRRETEQSRPSLESVTSQAAQAAQAAADDPSLSTVDSETGAGQPEEQAAERTYRTRHGTKAKMRVGRIGKKSKVRAEQSEEPAERASEAPAPEQQQFDLPFAGGSAHATPSPYPQATAAATSPPHDLLAALHACRARLDRLLATPRADDVEGAFDLLAAIDAEQGALGQLHAERWEQAVGVPVEGPA